MKRPDRVDPIEAGATGGCELPDRGSSSKPGLALHPEPSLQRHTSPFIKKKKAKQADSLHVGHRPGVTDLSLEREAGQLQLHSSETLP